MHNDDRATLPAAFAKERRRLAALLDGTSSRVTLHEDVAEFESLFTQLLGVNARAVPQDGSQRKALDKARAAVRQALEDLIPPAALRTDSAVNVVAGHWEAYGDVFTAVLAGEGTAQEDPFVVLWFDNVLRVHALWLRKLPDSPEHADVVARLRRGRNALPDALIGLATMAVAAVAGHSSA